MSGLQEIGRLVACEKGVTQMSFGCKFRRSGVRDWRPIYGHYCDLDDVTPMLMVSRGGLRAYLPIPGIVPIKVF
jgi:hypothetical protein